MKQILDPDAIGRILDRITFEILERCVPAEKIAILGIRTRGVPLADRLRAKLEQELGQPVPHGILDITLYRDDLDNLGGLPLVRETNISFDVDDMIVILVDDVIYTGRTTRAALDQLMDFGRPRAVLLAVLIDRGGRELPIQPDFAGKQLDFVAAGEKVSVKLQEQDGEEGVYLS